MKKRGLLELSEKNGGRDAGSLSARGQWMTLSMTNKNKIHE